MDDMELESVRRYLHTIQRSYPMRSGSCISRQLNKLVAITDSKLFEEIVTRKYRYEEFTLKKRRIKRRRFSPNTLAEVQCSGNEYCERLRALELPQDVEIHEVEIPDPGNASFEDIPLSQTLPNSIRSSDKKAADGVISWRTLGLQFGQILSADIADEGLYIASVKQESVGAASLIRGDRILAIEGIVLDKQTLNALNGNALMVEHGFRSVSVVVTTLYEIMTSVLDAWVKNKWSNQPDGRRTPLRLAISRCSLKAKPISPVPESDYMPILSAPHCEPQVENPQAMNYEPEEELMEIQMIDFPKTSSGIGAFLTPDVNGLGARVERLVEGELASLDGRLQVNDSILYINEKPVMNRTFRDVLRIYRRASTRTDYGLAALPYSPMHPIRLIVSRSLDCNGSSQPTSAHSITVPQSSVLFEAAKLAADVKEGSKNQSLSMTASPTISPDAIQFHEGSLLLIDGSKTSSDAAFISGPVGAPLVLLNLSDQMEGGVVIEEATSVDDASGKVEALGSPQLNVDGSDFNKVSTPPSVSPVTGFYQAYPAKSITFESEETSTCHLLSQEEKVLLQNHWRSVLNDDAEIIIGEYTLPSANAPLGISVETLGSIDRVGRQTDFRHRIVEVCRDGVVASQTGLEPMDEVLEVNGVTVMGKDSAFLTSTLQKPRISGYLVCSRSPNTISDQRHSSSTLTEDKMSVILEVSSSGTTQNDTVPVELEPGIERDETVSSSGSKISDLRRKFEAFSQKKTSTAPKSPVEAKVGDSKIAHRRPTQLRDLDDEQLSPSDASIISTNDSIEIIINKAKGELIGVTLGQKDDASGGFTVTDIAPNGALRRTLNSVAVYRRVHFDVGDVVTELNGTHLRHATLFGVQSLLWSMFSLEGTVSLKFTSKASTKSQHTVSAEVHERRPIDRILKPGTSASKPNVSSVSSTSKLSGCGAFLLDISSPVIKTSGAHVHASSMETTRVPSKAPGRSNEVVSNSDNSLAQSTNSSSNLEHSNDHWVLPHGFIKLMVERYMRTERDT